MSTEFLEKSFVESKSEDIVVFTPKLSTFRLKNENTNHRKQRNLVFKRKNVDIGKKKLKRKCRKAILMKRKKHKKIENGTAKRRKNKKITPKISTYQKFTPK